MGRGGAEHPGEHDGMCPCFLEKNMSLGAQVVGLIVGFFMVLGVCAMVICGIVCLAQVAQLLSTLEDANCP